MGVIEKYINKRTVVILSTVIAGLLTLSVLFGNAVNINTGSYSSLDSLSSSLTTLSILIRVLEIGFFAVLVMSIITAILAALYFFKKNNTEYTMLIEFIATAAIGLFMLIATPGYVAACKIVQAVASGDYSAAYSALGSLGSMQTASSMLTIVKILGIVLLLFDIFLLLAGTGKVNINGVGFRFDDQTYTSVPAENGGVKAPGFDGEKAKETAAAAGNGLKNFFKSTAGKITIGLLAAAIAGFGGFKIYDTFFNFTTVDLSEGIKVEFTGKDGKGYASVNFDTSVYNDENDDVKAFVNTCYSDYNYSSTLKNGDKFTVTIKYSEETASEYKIKVKNESKEFTVEGLTERYADGSKVSADVKKKLDEDAEKKIKDLTTTDSSSYSYKYTLSKTYFAHDDSYDYDRALYTYKIDETYGDKTESFYIVVYSSTVDSDYNSDNAYWSYSYLYGDDYNRVTKEKDVLSALQKNYSNYTITEL